MSVYNYRDPKNPKVFMDISRDKIMLGRMVFEVINVSEKCYSCTRITVPRLSKTSDLYVVETMKRNLHTRSVPFIESLEGLWLKEEISRIMMVLVGNLYMAKSLEMRT